MKKHLTENLWSQANYANGNQLVFYAMFDVDLTIQNVRDRDRYIKRGREREREKDISISFVGWLQSEAYIWMIITT